MRAVCAKLNIPTTPTADWNRFGLSDRGKTPALTKSYFESFLRLQRFSRANIWGRAIVRHVWLVARPLSDGHCPAVLPSGFRAHPSFVQSDSVRTYTRPNPNRVSSIESTPLSLGRLYRMEHHGIINVGLRNAPALAWQTPRPAFWSAASGLGVTSHSRARRDCIRVSFSSLKFSAKFSPPPLPLPIRNPAPHQPPIRQAGAMIRRFDGETYDIEDIEKIYQRADFPSSFRLGDVSPPQ
jgi:hypothetical protein